MADVVVIAGTKDARQIACDIAGLGVKVAATVTTEFGRQLFTGNNGIEIFEGKLDADQMACLIRSTGARCLIDASHPFARVASANSIKACQQAGIPYLRFERKTTVVDDGRVLFAETFEAAAEKAAALTGNIFLTIGSNNLEVFTKKIADFKDRLFARVLPDSRVLIKCEDLGLNAGNIIALKGPFSVEINIEMLKYCNAKVLVTKDSGETGGVEDKLEAAMRLGITAIVVQRPEIEYTDKVDSIADVLKFVKKTVVMGR